jgi:hypothetical protein
MPDTPVEPNADDPYHPGLETRVSRLEDDVCDVKATKIRATLDAALPPRSPS